jgi:hypothetical protein
MNKNLMMVNQMASATVEQLTDAIKGDHQFDLDISLSESLSEISKELHARDGEFPTTLDGFKDCGVDDNVAQQLMQDVFGSTEIVIGLNTRKTVVALDLIDWEALGIDRQSDVKTRDVTASHVKNSVKTWLPAGMGIDFQDAVESIGEVISLNKSGFWGKLTATINKHFKPSEKVKLMKMADDILRYAKATKCGARVKFRF